MSAKDQLSQDLGAVLHQHQLDPVYLNDIMDILDEVGALDGLDIEADQ